MPLLLYYEKRTVEYIDNMQVEFETVDDVSVRKLHPETIDDNEDKFRNLVISTSGIKAIQVI